MLLSQSAFFRLLANAANKWIDAAPLLGDIDARFGDGDHGITMERIAGLVLREIQDTDAPCLGGFLDELGTYIMALGAGSSGALYGTMFSGFGEAFGDQQAIDGPLLKAMLESGLAAVRELTPATVGDKTMMDALIPAVEAARAADDSVSGILAAAAEAAVTGREATKQFIAKYGRARGYGSQTLGTADAGAVSTALFFEGLHEAMDSIQEAVSSENEEISQRAREHYQGGP